MKIAYIAVLMASLALHAAAAPIVIAIKGA
jgi:hypothetical protein